MCDRNLCVLGVINRRHDDKSSVDASDKKRDDDHNRLVNSNNNVVTKCLLKVASTEGFYDCMADNGS